jgi:hypothetical protein
VALVPVGRQKHHAHPILPRLRQVNVQSRAGVLQERMGELQEDARPITGIGFTATGTTVIQVLKNCQGLLHNGVRFSSLNIHNETNTACIVFESGVIETLFVGGVRSCHDGPFLMLQ